jgi:hypothetical protein
LLARAPRDGKPDCTVRIAAPPRRDLDVSWFHAWRGRGRPTWLSIGRLAAGGYLLRFRELADFEVSGDARGIVARPAAKLPLDTLRHLLVDQVLPLVVSRHGRLSLHASAVHLTGIGTIGFVGETGRGKSTLAAAFALEGAQVVADDCLALDLGGAGATAISAYPGLRLWPTGAGRQMLSRDLARQTVAHYSTKRRAAGASFRFRAAPSPMRALFLLRPRGTKGPAAQITACGPSARVMGLLRCAYILDVEDRRDLSSAFDRLAVTAGRVPVMRLRVRHGHSRLTAAADTIRDFLARA